MRLLPYYFLVFLSLAVVYSAQCQINITPTSFCAGDTVILDASALAELQEGTNSSSLQFSSGNYMRIPISDALSDFEQVTIEFWYYQISSGEEFIIATEYFNTGWGFHNENPNVLQWRVEGGPYSLGGSNFSIPNNEWIHVAGVYDSQELRLYVDGNLIASEAFTGTMSDSRNEDIVVNRHVWASGSSSRLSGYLDELRISGIARYNDNFTPPEYDFVSDEQTLGLWHFDELSGNMLSDDSGFDNHGQSSGVGTTSSVPYSDYNVAADVTYVWSNGETQSTVQVVPIDLSTYSVVLENGGTTVEESIVLNPNMTCCPGPGCCDEGLHWDWIQNKCIDTNPTDINLDGCTDLNDLMDLLSGYGDCAVVEFTCGDDIEHQGYSYSTVQIGEQCWFSENCRYLPEVSPSSEGSETEPYYYVYDYQGTDVEEAQATANYETYGVLYNWPAAITEGLCPSGWYVPTDTDFTQLIDFIGGESVAGDAMKSTSGWSNNGNGSNSSGFEGLPGGYNWSNGLIDIGYNATWWSSSASNSSEAWQRRLYGDVDNVNRFSDHRHNGFSVRCIKD